MAHRINSRNTLDPVENISYIKGAVLSVDYKNDTADIQSNEHIYKKIPVFYNCDKAGSVQSNGSIKNSSKAFSRGDEVIVRMYKGEPSHVIGFTGDLWPCIQVPAYIFTGDAPYLYDIQTGEFSGIDSQLFYDRYKEAAQGGGEKYFTTYINQPDADINSGFVSSQTHWTDTEYHRESKFYYNGGLIYSTYNSETFSHVFNGTRSNYLGIFAHPDTGWGALVYQVNTFHDWKPQVSGRVQFDFYLYTSTGTHTKLASAEAEITGASVIASGGVVSSVSFSEINDDYTGEMLLGSLKICDAGAFSSNGSTNNIGSGSPRSKLFIKTEHGTDKPSDSFFSIGLNSDGGIALPDGQTAYNGFKIYIKNR